MNIKKWGLVFASLSIFLAGWLLGTSILSEKSKIDNSNNEADVLLEEIKSAEKRLSFLKKKVKAIDTPESAHLAATNSLDSGVDKVFSFDQKKTPNMPSVLPNGFAPKSNFMRLDDAIKKFQSETRNDEWAGVREERLRDTFAADPNLFGREVHSVECKSTICRAQVRSENKQDAVSIAQQINMQIVTKQSKYFVPRINLTFDDENNLANFYLIHE